MIGAPTSATICGRSSSLCFVSAACSWRRHFARLARFVDQSVVSNARRAAAIARSMSSRVASATWPITSSVAGFTFGYERPPVAFTSFPSIKRRLSPVSDIAPPRSLWGAAILDRSKHECAHLGHRPLHPFLEPVRGVAARLFPAAHPLRGEAHRRLELLGSAQRHVQQQNAER